LGETGEFLRNCGAPNLQAAISLHETAKAAKRRRSEAFLMGRKEKARRVLSRKLGREATDADMRTAWIRKQHDKWKARQRFRKGTIADGLKEIVGR
jgi:hypothetical protein